MLGFFLDLWYIDDYTIRFASLEVLRLESLFRTVNINDVEVIQRWSLL